MKRLAALIIAAVLLAALPICSFAEDLGPYWEKNDEGFYTDLPDAGVYANGEIILDNDMAKVTILRCTYCDSYPQYQIALLIENRTDNDITAKTANAIVNGFSFESFGETDVKAGAMVETQLYIMADSFARAKISTPDEIKFNISFFDCESGEYLDTAYFAIYPSGLSIEQISYLTVDDIGYADLEYYNSATGCNFRIIDGKLIENTDFYGLELIIENTSDMHQVYSLKDVKVNGIDIDPLWLEGLSGHTLLLSNIYFDMTELAQSGVEEVDSIEFVFTVDNAQRTLLSQYIYFRPSKG